ncbi:hypothetical protein PhCBS80983_g04346 [Powellomyces hirtus]|uniref:Core Histone H2A/H2B/H3 domain-containing protein n=1 Tax=Powellomyces hirtus TaxID=109895 RepID=A0A507DYS1_9FUNG|nr:hypothetical protein PhCBS80983_g04346 [Powellomyces hirtus]
MARDRSCNTQSGASGGGKKPSGPNNPKFTGIKMVLQPRQREKKPMPTGDLALREIQKYQKSADLLIARAPFRHLFHQIANEQSPLQTGFRWEKTACDALQGAAESYLIALFQDALLLAIHAHRVGLKPEDVRLVRLPEGEKEQSPSGEPGPDNPKK